jgi:hypothetical protein
MEKLVSPLEELNSLKHEIELLRSRVEEEAAHVPGLSGQPELARQAQDALEASTDELRQMLIELEELRTRVEQEVAASKA